MICSCMYVCTYVHTMDVQITAWHLILQLRSFPCDILLACLIREVLRNGEYRRVIVYKYGE